MQTDTGWNRFVLRPQMSREETFDGSSYLILNSPLRSSSTSATLTTSLWRSSLS